MSAKGSRRRMTGGIAFLILVLPMGLIVLPTTVLVAIGLIPTLVATMIDRDPEKSAGITVGAMNICGVMPFAIDLWRTSHTLDTTLVLLSDPFTWMVMYGAAAIGWLVYFVLPPMVAGVVVLRDQERLRELEAECKTLVDEWGQEVAGLAKAQAQETLPGDDDSESGEMPAHPANAGGEQMAES